MESNEQLIFTPFPCHRHPAAGHPLRDLPAHRGLPARRAGEALTEHYRRAHLEALGLPAQ